MMSYLKHHWKKISLILFLFIIFLSHYQYKMPKRNFADFHVNYYTGRRMLAGQNVYDIEAYRKDKVAIFKYPPLFALITALFALTSERIAATIWFIFNFIFIIMFMSFSGRLIFKDKLINRQKNWIYFWSLFLVSRFFLDNFDEGQVNILMMTALLLGIYAVYKKRELLAGFLIGFSILVKYMSAIFIPFFLIRKRIKLIFYIFLFLIIFSLLPALFLGWERNLYLQSQYLTHLTKSSLDFYSLSDEANQSLLSMIIRFFSTHAHRTHGYLGINFMNLGDYYLGVLTGIVCGSMYILCLLTANNNNNNVFTIINQLNNIDIGLLSICIALFNPNAWLHAFIFLTFAYMVVFFYLFKIKFIDRLVLILIILSFVFHSFTNSFLTRSWAQDLFEIYSLVTFGAIFLFLALLKIKFFPLTNFKLSNKI